MSRWLSLFLVLLAVGPALAQDAAAPSPAPSPAPETRPSSAPAAAADPIIPTPEERAILERIENLKKEPPKDTAEEARVRKEYVAALREHVAKFPRSPRAYLVLSALVQLLGQTGDAAGADEAALGFIKRAQNPEESFWGHNLLVELYTATQRPEKAIEAIEAYLKTQPPADTIEAFTYRLAGLYADSEKFAAAIALLEDHLKANPTTTQRSRFRLRIIDLLLSAGRAADAITRLETFSKGAVDDEDKALATYFLGIAHLALSREAAPDKAADLRKKALTFQETLMAGVRKDVRANEPYGAMAFSAAADVHLASGDKAGAVKCYQEMRELFKDRPEGTYAARAIGDTELIGTKIADVSGPGLDGKPVSVGSFAGKIVLVTPWATWLEPSSLEAPMVARLLKVHKDRPFAVLGVCLNRQEDEAAVRQLASRLQITWPALFDGKGYDGVCGKLFKTEGPPGNLVVDETGTIVRANVHGTHLKDVLATEIARLQRQSKK